MQLKRVDEAIKSIKNGEMIIIMDDENRENEGDIVYAGEFSSPEKVNFLVTEARGVLCVSITSDIAKKLDFPLMVNDNSSNHETAFTVSVDAKSAKTGVSAFERDLTIKLICNEDSKPSDFARPGHIFPLIAKKGGVLVRTGHTEASVDICKLAGLKPISVICELMKNDGSMANNNDDFVIKFAKKHNLKILYVSDLVYYKLQYEQLVNKIEERNTSFFGIDCNKIVFIDHLGLKHIVYKFSESPNIKFHTFNNILGLLENEEFSILSKSIEFFKKNGGYFIFINGDKNTNIIENKTFGIGAQILKYLKITDFNLLVTHKNKQYIALDGFGLKIKEEILIS
ncbi:bifunctional 3,4-dihydroxy-2-butanone 4-phosphate synthase/GTP cyclohydrolase II [Helicobacter sp. MIT 14-3879]|uniref:bifunctional 3,4-dihydroxy-2-butanone 4-phosphate synthase/GTP cyclohydrolase II n=1 Tax=Helicobacter sp. MIT 14-3879 TaxID=2040649 RepID=UPI000E1E3F39|nr:bifunctional 3,4-dihydroxy-2-butanone 4-phosphate synthase/GTP cyclohydrolase II [Helicobacter sp. MIT 14-3879]RDU64198.1 bifunctional 3,4-dihydroxy-2-butanone 4-phosphate synthase/GTP cyclohydrolase II [Helicobacter sp. MIT 14-3879]